MAKTSTIWKSSANLTELYKLIQLEMESVELLLASNLIDDNVYIRELLGQIFQSGGKRLRPMVAILASYASLPQPELSRNHIIHAALSELIHTASLVHDDVIDNSNLRRGKATLNSEKNDKVAVLMGDLLFAQASVCLSRLMHPEIVGIYGQVLGDLCAGEIKQMLNAFNTNITIDTYIQKSIGKTATLFEAASCGGSILNQVNNSLVLDLKAYGLNLGICFQIIDDLLDILGKASELGKPLGSDLQNGVITAPTIYVLQQDHGDSLKLKELIQKRLVNEPAGLAEAMTIIKNNKGIESTIDLANKYADLSLKSLHNLSVSPYKDALETIVHQVIQQIN